MYGGMIDTTIVQAERGMNSKSGNPRYKLRLATGATVRTAPDSQVNHVITEYVSKPVRLYIDDDGYVYAITKGDEVLDYFGRYSG